MDVPLELSFRDVKNTPALEAQVRRRVEKLERFCDRVNSCRVAVERPHRNESSGNPYRVRIDLTVRPGHELVVSREPADEDAHRELRAVVNDAFDAAERQLKDLVARQREGLHDRPDAGEQAAAPPPGG